MSDATVLAPPARVTIIGLGQMGLPMAARLVGAGFVVHGADPSPQARAAFQGRGGKPFTSNREAAAGADAVILMLPNGRIVREVLLGEDGIVATLAPGTVLIDMSSSAPTGTARLAAELQGRGFTLVDAPVSGGVKRAVDGSLAIMVGGPEAVVDRIRPLLQAMGKSIFPTGPIGSGHAMKALNNFVSAAGLVAACEALLVGRKFGLEPEVIVDVLNASSGRNNATEVKMKQFVISETFGSGFSFALMVKDLATAAELARDMELALPDFAEAARLWSDGQKCIPADADHTRIFNVLSALATGGK